MGWIELKRAGDVVHDWFGSVAKSHQHRRWHRQATIQYSLTGDCFASIVSTSSLPTPRPQRVIGLDRDKIDPCPYSLTSDF